MKAVVCNEYGSPRVLKMAEVERPKPKKNEVLIQIHAGTVTAGDTRLRSFNVPKSVKIPAMLALGITKPRNPILGMECAGVVIEMGSAVSKFKIGDRVMAATADHKFGSYAEFVAFPENGVIAKIPDDVGMDDAAPLTVGGRTAHYFIEKAEITANQKVLIYGASSSVGAYAIQLAKLKGAEVTAVCSAKNHELVSNLGADKIIDYHVEDFTQNGELYDVIFDVVGKLELKHALKSLNEHGAYAHAVGTPDIAIKAALLKRKKRFRFIGGGSGKKSDDLNYLGQLLANGQIKTPIEKYYTMKDLPEAHAHVDSGRKAGNVIVQMMSLIL